MSMDSDGYPSELHFRKINTNIVEKYSKVDKCFIEKKNHDKKQL